MTDVTDERSEAQSTTEQVTEQVQEHVQDAASAAKVQTREQLRTQIDTRSGEVGEQLASSGQAMRRTSEQLRSEGKGRAADLVDGVADRSERLGAYLVRADSDRILGDVEEFARKQPWLVAGSGVVLGFLASRFVKASSSSRYQGRAGTTTDATRNTSGFEGSSPSAGSAAPALGAGNGGGLE
jgi:ElaB/YqjD/DUF883 family membrane-anchored ribosome-binding protein